MRRHGKTRSPIDPSWLAAASRDIPGLTRFVIHLPAESPDSDPLSKTHASSPCCALQWYFDDLGLLETSTANQRRDAQDRGSHNERCRSRSHVRAASHGSQAIRHTEIQAKPGHRAERCTYLVSYEGEAEDFNAWLTHYLTHHPPLMAQLPGIRELEIYTRLDFRSGLSYSARHRHAA